MANLKYTNSNSFTLERFAVEGLHGQHSVDVPIYQNQLILVGENGTGKTTIITLLYLFLSRQWTRLFTYDFESIAATINGKAVEINRKKLINSLSSNIQKVERIKYELNRMQKDRIKNLVSRRFGDIQQVDKRLFRHMVFEISDRLDMPSHIVEDFLAAHYALQVGLSDHPDIKILDDMLSSAWSGQFVYLPTYRRIEQDLKSIFPDMDVDEFFERRLIQRTSDRVHSELVEFGMKDVEQQIDKKMKELQDFITTSLKTLTGSYLSEIIGSRYQSVGYEDIENLSGAEIDDILSRIEESILAREDKDQIRTTILELKPEHQLTEGMRIIAHFLSKLKDLYAQQQIQEDDTHQLIEICNKYLVGKRLIFDSNNFKISVSLIQGSENLDKRIALKQLSSGEKQIVSLFCHLYLSGRQPFFLLIDEPELSLSVPWQKTFLEDILNTNKCSGIIAVTHSPFIFDNSLENSAHSISEFKKEYEKFS